jgi:hypothetical protein
MNYWIVVYLVKTCVNIFVKRKRRERCRKSSTVRQCSGIENCTESGVQANERLETEVQFDNEVENVSNRNINRPKGHKNLEK